jgi:hypothetical protein
VHGCVSGKSDTKGSKNFLTAASLVLLLLLSIGSDVEISGDVDPVTRYRSKTNSECKSV